MAPLREVPFPLSGAAAISRGPARPRRSPLSRRPTKDPESILVPRRATCDRTARRRAACHRLCVHHILSSGEPNAPTAAACTRWPRRRSLVLNGQPRVHTESHRAGWRSTEVDGEVEGKSTHSLPMATKQWLHTQPLTQTGQYCCSKGVYLDTKSCDLW
ncbi:hypothetical protein EYF80_004748 [Liparis tanakae]|uniref:Uncharacterized protein n=1 Tax=Liparis tanakae TaxID=230148 RepID=A0A4Z2J5D7_9TELE|nr:hypothetical protein EYF80_004748 [Liparis tanakae]